MDKVFKKMDGVAVVYSEKNDAVLMAFKDMPTGKQIKLGSLSANKEQFEFLKLRENGSEEQFKANLPELGSLTAEEILGYVMYLTWK